MDEGVDGGGFMDVSAAYWGSLGTFEAIRIYHASAVI
jgi:hypothetical protein